MSTHPDYYSPNQFYNKDQCESHKNYWSADRVHVRLHTQFLESQSLRSLQSYIRSLQSMTDKAPRYVFSAKPKLNAKSGCIDYIYDLYRQF